MVQKGERCSSVVLNMAALSRPVYERKQANTYYQVLQYCNTILHNRKNKHAFA